jgi:hypothetical protein
MDPSGGVEEPSGNAPQRNKEPRSLCQPIIAGRRSQTPGAFGRNAFVRRQRDLDLARRAIPVAAKPDVLVNKTRKMLNGVQNRLNLQLNSWSPG